MLFRKILKREDLDERQFSDEAQTYLAEIRGGCPEPEARTRTRAEYPHLRDHHFVEWGQNEAFRGFLRDFQTMGAEARSWDARQAEARRGYDPFSAIPARDDPQPGPEGAHERFIRHGLEVLAGTRQHQVDPGFVALEDVTPAMQAQIRAQYAAPRNAQAGALTKAERERQQAMGTYQPPDIERGWDGT